MSIGVILKDVLVATSGLALGLCAISVYGVWARPYRRMAKVAWSLLMAGIALRVGLLLELIWVSASVPPSARAYVYLAGLVATCIGSGLLLRYRP